MRAVELFAGAGGFALGLAETGVEALALVEWDKSACATLRAAGFKHVAEGDVDRWLVTQADKYHGRADLLTAGFPCQAHSTAGKRLGARDDRNKWPQTYEAIERILPRWVILENVRGLTLHKADSGCARGRHPKPLYCSGCYLDHVIVPQLAVLYPYVEWRLLDAADFGVPQRRIRWICVAGPHPIDWPEPTHSGEALAVAKWVTGTYWAKLGIDPVGEPSKDEQRWLKASSPRHRLLPWTTMREALGIDLPVRHQSPTAGTIQRSADDTAPTVGGKGTLFVEGQAHKGPENPMIRRGILGGGYNPPAGQKHRRTERDITDEPSTTISTAGGNALPQEVMFREDPKHPWAEPDHPGPAVRSGGDGHTAPPLYLKEHPSLQASVRMHREASPLDPAHADTVAPTVTTTEEKGTRASPASDWTMSGGPDRASDAAWLATGRRRLEPRELAILQDFPAGYPFQGTKTAQYQQIGNACPPTLARVVVKAVLRADRGHR